MEIIDPARACPQGISIVLRPITGGFGWRLRPLVGLAEHFSANLSQLAFLKPPDREGPSSCQLFSGIAFCQMEETFKIKHI